MNNIQLISRFRDPIRNGTLSFDRNSTAEDVTTGLDLSGKTALLTGCNSGIGLETMRVLVQRGANVFALARSADKARVACSSVMGSGVKGKAVPFECELESFDSVTQCAKDVSTAQMPLDIVICNAGLEVFQLEQINGIEKQFVVNHLSHFLLVNRILKLVKAARQGRIVLVSSSFSYLHAPDVGIEFDNLTGQGGYAEDVHKLYSQSKLANVLFANELARRLENSSATCNSLHPGYIRTNITRHAKTSLHRRWFEPARRLMWRLRGVQFKTTPQGAATICYVATRPELSRVSGQYFEDCKVVVHPGHGANRFMAEKLWTVSEQLTQPYLADDIR